jgi:transposase-like protein
LVKETQKRQYKLANQGGYAQMNRTKEMAVKETGMKLPYSGDPLSEALRNRVREAIAEIFTEELDAAVGAGAYERTERRRGYRHGSEERQITTAFGKTTFSMPRGKIFGGDGATKEWQSAMLPRYARRAREVDAAIIGMYFGGVNTRKVKQAIRPLLRNSPLSKSTISRLIVRLKDYFEAWRTRSLAEEDIRYVFLDGTYVRVRCAGRTGSLPVLAAIGVRANGEKILLSLEVRGGEGETAWKGFLENMTSRGLRAPTLAIIDGSQGLAKALDVIWPNADRQRCVVHKLRNLLSHAPERLYEEIRADFHAIVYAEDGIVGKAAYDRMLKKWRKQLEGVARSLEEGGLELLTFYRYPKSQWKALRTTNAIERINQEFRRRIKTQCSFPSESSVLVVLFGLVATGMIRMRRIGGYEDMPLTETERCLAAHDAASVDLKAAPCILEKGLPGNLGQSMRIGVAAY